MPIERCFARRSRPVIELPLEALTYLAAYIAITIITPQILGRTTLIVRFPAAIILLWLISLTASLLSLWHGTGLLISESIRRQVTGESINNWFSSVIGSILTWLSLAFLGVITFRIMAAIETLRAERASAIEEIAPLLRGATITEYRGIRVYEVSSNQPLIAAVPWANAIAISSELRKRVPPKLLEPAFEHELTHLRWHHSVLVSVAALAVTAAGGIRASRRFAQAVRIAVELTADDAASRRLGRLQVAESLAEVYPNDEQVSERIKRLRRAQ